MSDRDVLQAVTTLYRQHHANLTEKHVFEYFNTYYRGNIDKTYKRYVITLISNCEWLVGAWKAIQNNRIKEVPLLSSTKNTGTVVTNPRNILGTSSATVPPQPAPKSWAHSDKSDDEFWDEWDEPSPSIQPSVSTTQVLPFALEQITFIRAEHLKKIEQGAANVNHADIVIMFMLTVLGKLIEGMSTNCVVTHIFTDNSIVMQQSQTIKQFIVSRGYRCEIIKTEFNTMVFMVHRH